MCKPALIDTQSKRTGRGKLVLLACSLGFHVIALERSSFMKIVFLKSDGRTDTLTNQVLQPSLRMRAEG